MRKPPTRPTSPFSPRPGQDSSPVSVEVPQKKKKKKRREKSGRPLPRRERVRRVPLKCDGDATTLRQLAFELDSYRLAINDRILVNFGSRVTVRAGNRKVKNAAFFSFFFVSKTSSCLFFSVGFFRVSFAPLLFLAGALPFRGLDFAPFFFLLVLLQFPLSIFRFYCLFNSLPQRRSRVSRRKRQTENDRQRSPATNN